MTPRKPPPRRTPAPAADPDPDEEKILTPAEVARLFHVHPATVTQWANDGKLASFRTLGGTRRYYATEIEQRLRDSGRKR